MAWDIPTPTEIADQASSDIEEAMRPVMTAKGLDPARLDARSERSVFRALAVVIGLALYPVYLFFVWILDQLFVDRCSEVWLAVHARIWGIARRAAIRAVGSVTFTGTSGTSIPAGTRLTLSGATWSTTAVATIPSGGTVSVAVQAVSAGVAGNQAAGTSLPLETAIIGLAAQTASVDAGGISGGRDIETVASWRGRVVERIRVRPHGGADFDYAYWASDILAPARVKVHRAWIGAGTVGVAFAMAEYDSAGAIASFRTPTPTEVATMQAGFDAVAPVTATVIALAAVPLAIDLTVAVSPYTTAVEVAVEAAAAAFFLGDDVQIAGKIHRSRLSERMSRAAGEQWHAISAPAADVSPGALEFPVLGTVVVEEAT